MNKSTDISEKLGQLRRQEEEAATQRQAAKYGLPYADLSIFPINTETLYTLSEIEAKAGGLIVLKKQADQLTIALVDPGSPKTQEIISELSKKFNQINQTVVSPSSLNRAFSFYRIKTADTPLVGKIAISQKCLDDFNERAKTVNELKEEIARLSTSEILETIIAGSLKTGAGDIHIEPAQKEVLLRCRIDGVLQEIAALSKKSYNALLSRIKILSDLAINVHDRSQDGRFTIQIIGADSQGEKRVNQEIEVRVSILPQGESETVVMRLLGVGIGELSIENLEIQSDLLQKIKDELTKPNGMILNTGPTGSGKTTTLYSFLNYLNNPKIKIITIEDPIEYRLAGIVQTQISEDYSFAKALRAILRQNPNIIMVGEIRDEETAKTAVQAALTGHLVISTLHTNDAPGTISRLTNLGVSGADFASAFNFIMAQRLVRKLCPACKKTFKPDKKTLTLIHDIVADIPRSSGRAPDVSKAKFYQAGSCARCNDNGYKGRTAIFEFLFKDESLETLIAKGGQTLEIKKAAKAQGMLTLRQDGLLKALDGLTTIEEVERVTGELGKAEI